MDVPDLRDALQAAIGPVIVISGVGLLLMCMTNRYARVIDRGRRLAEALRETPAPGRAAELCSQLAIMVHRGRLLRLAVMLATFTVLLVALIIMTLFVNALLTLNVGLVVAALFFFAMVSLILSLIAFILDFNISLNALEVEVNAALKAARRRDAA